MIYLSLSLPMHINLLPQKWFGTWETQWQWEDDLHFTVLYYLNFKTYHYRLYIENINNTTCKEFGFENEKVSCESLGKFTKTVSSARGLVLGVPGLAWTTQKTKQNKTSMYPSPLSVKLLIYAFTSKIAHTNLWKYYFTHLRDETVAQNWRKVPQPEECKVNL